jgi:hypothetical protein
MSVKDSLQNGEIHLQTIYRRINIEYIRSLKIIQLKTDNTISFQKKYKWAENAWRSGPYF